MLVNWRTTTYFALDVHDKRPFGTIFDFISSIVLLTSSWASLGLTSNGFYS